MKETVVSEETKQKIYMLWRVCKNKAEVGRMVNLCRKKVAQIIHQNEHQQLFDVEKQKNWLIND